MRLKIWVPSYQNPTGTQASSSAPILKVSGPLPSLLLSFGTPACRYNKGGFIGVDVFFVLSGYLITALLTKELNPSGRINLSRFYARRVRRLLPALSVVVVIVCMIQTIIASPIAQFAVLKVALATMLYSSNIYFAHIQLYYFAQSYATNPLLHTWSLGVEEQFYFIWPVFLLLPWRLVENHRIRIFILIATTLVSFAGCIFLTALNPVTAFFQSPARAWEFGLGGLVSLVPVGWSTAHQALCQWFGIAGLTVLILSSISIVDSSSFPGYIAAIPVLATRGTSEPWRTGSALKYGDRLLHLRVLQYVGGISYSLYLWHWPIPVMARGFYPANSAAVRTAGAILAFLFAALTHVIVENPIRFNSFLASRSLLSLKMAGLSSVLLKASSTVRTSLRTLSG